MARVANVRPMSATSVRVCGWSALPMTRTVLPLIAAAETRGMWA